MFKKIILITILITSVVNLFLLMSSYKLYKNHIYRNLVQNSDNFKVEMIQFKNINQHDFTYRSKNNKVYHLSVKEHFEQIHEINMYSKQGDFLFLEYMYFDRKYCLISIFDLGYKTYFNYSQKCIPIKF